MTHEYTRRACEICIAVNRTIPIRAKGVGDPAARDAEFRTAPVPSSPIPDLAHGSRGPAAHDAEEFRIALIRPSRSSTRAKASVLQPRVMLNSASPWCDPSRASHNAHGRVARSHPEGNSCISARDGDDAVRHSTWAPPTRRSARASGHAPRSPPPPPSTTPLTPPAEPPRPPPLPTQAPKTPNTSMLNATTDKNRTSHHLPDKRKSRRFPGTRPCSPALKRTGEKSGPERQNSTSGTTGPPTPSHGSRIGMVGSGRCRILPSSATGPPGPARAQLAPLSRGWVLSSVGQAKPGQGSMPRSLG